MAATYDTYYQTENFFGEPYPELIEFFVALQKKGKVLDLGCGQGRNAIALARLGYTVMGIDKSKVGIDQMNKIGRAENLNLVGQIKDIYAFEDFDQFNIVLLDSMLHFAQHDKKKEIGLVKKIVSIITKGSLLVVCIQDTENKIQLLNQAIDYDKQLSRSSDRKIKYTFEDDESGHKSEIEYRMIVIKK